MKQRLTRLLAFARTCLAALLAIALILAPDADAQAHGGRFEPQEVHSVPHLLDASAGNYWYYCESTHTYYPYFPYYPAQCTEGRPIMPATPPQPQ